jgi:murein DD-endopeptidase MepM/ murein hydrolase activator NlpD
MGELDSLEVVIDMQYQYINNLRSIIGGEVDFIQPNLIVEKDNFSPNIINLNNTISVADSTLRIYVEHEEDVLNLFNFITPTSGFVTDTFNITEKHYGIDVATNELEKIYSILDGAVLISGKNLDFGNFLIISHPENLMSIYMHASSFTKTSGDSVYSGDLIGFTGNTGALSNGTHLHFELRYNGVPINPKKYIAF